MDLISVVIPIFKVEKLIERCIDSIINQTYKKLDIILVDDGSPDRCGEICDCYAQKDTRIRVIHKENGGLSDARNAGIDIAEGKYISFVDSDDWVSPNYIGNLYFAIRKDCADVAVSQFEEVFKGNSPKTKSSSYLVNYEKLNTNQCLERLFYQNGLELCAWGKLYKTECFKELRYPVGKLYEDIPVTYRIFAMCSKVALVQNVDYYYFQRLQSIQYQSFNPRKLDAIEHTQKMLCLVSQQFPELEDAAICRYFSCVCNILFQIRKTEDEAYRQELWDIVKHCRRVVVCNRKARKKARLAALVSYFGYGALFCVYRYTQQRAMRGALDGKENK